MKFKTKIHPVHLFITVLFIPIILLTLYFGAHNNIGSIGLILINIITFVSIYTSSYEITDKGLVVNYIWINKEIPFEKIRHLRYSGKPSKSNRWSMQQIEVMYGMYETYSVGVPREEEEFLRMLQEKCPQMKIIDRPVMEPTIVENEK
ncbi:PH domain-containing protein [Bacillus sp. NPDC094106]|uniref:PH domain-containing protein n=1 Tax=Bacillus sp. NPDC094106 TaxID=3363949 RepID=UPI0038132764